MARTRHLLIAASLIWMVGCSASESTEPTAQAPTALTDATAPAAATSPATPATTSQSPTTDAVPDTTSEPTTPPTTTDAPIGRDIVVDQQTTTPPEGVDRDALLVTYRMPGSAGTEVQATATVLIPTTPAPAEGWPIIVYSSGANGIAPECATSLAPNLNGQASFVAPMVAAGAVVAIPDGEGVIDGGRPTFRDARSQAITALSAVRAASETVDGTSTIWAAVGYSLGGQATIAAAEASDRLPDFDFRGALAVAPASDPVAQSKAYDDRIEGDDPAAAKTAAVFKNLLLGWMIEGLAVRYPAVDPSNVGGDQADELAAVLHEDCAVDAFIAISAMVDAHVAAGGTPASFGGLRPTWFDDPAIAVALETNAIGSGTVTAPITIVHGPADEVDPFAATLALVDTMRAHEVDVTLIETAAPNHTAFVFDAATFAARDEFVAQVIGD